MTRIPSDQALPGGTWFVVPTPFEEDGSLDTESQRSLVDAAIAWGVDGLTAMGVTSEPGALTTAERGAALRAIFETAGGRVPITVGCSAGSVQMVAALMEEARELGAVGAMVSAPPLIKNVDVLPGFYQRVTRHDLTLVVQDEPVGTGVHIPPSVLLASLKASGARTVKLEDPPTPPKIARLVQADPGIRVFGGLGGISALYELEAGACGTMTGFAFPEILAMIRHAHQAGERQLAARLFDRYLPLIQFEAQPGVGLAIRKETLRRRGVIRSSAVRGPAAVIDSGTAEQLGGVLARVGIAPSQEALRPSLG